MSLLSGTQWSEEDGRLLRGWSEVRGVAVCRKVFSSMMRETLHLGRCDRLPHLGGGGIGSS